MGFLGKSRTAYCTSIWTFTSMCQHVMFHMSWMIAFVLTILTMMYTILFVLNFHPIILKDIEWCTYKIEKAFSWVNTITVTIDTHIRHYLLHFKIYFVLTTLLFHLYANLTYHRIPARWLDFNVYTIPSEKYLKKSFLYIDIDVLQFQPLPI